MFGGKRKWQPLKRDKSTSRDFVARLATSRPKKLAPLAKKLLRSICGKSSNQSKQINPPLFAYTVSNRIKPPWDETAFPDLIIFHYILVANGVDSMFSTVFMTLKILFWNISKMLS